MGPLRRSSAAWRRSSLWSRVGVGGRAPPCRAGGGVVAPPPVLEPPRRAGTTCATAPPLGCVGESRSGQRVGGIAAASPPVCCPMPGPPLMRRPGSPGGGGPSRWRRGGRGCAGPRARLLDGPVRYPVAAPPADCVRVARLTRQDVASPLPRRPRSCERHEYIRDTDMNAVEPQSGKGHGPPRGEEGSCTM